jgi:hypothetical protein
MNAFFPYEWHAVFSPLLRDDSPLDEADVYQLARLDTFQGEPCHTAEEIEKVWLAESVVVASYTYNWRVNRQFTIRSKEVFRDGKKVLVFSKFSEQDKNDMLIEMNHSINGLRKEFSRLAAWVGLPGE